LSNKNLYYNQKLSCHRLVALGISSVVIQGHIMFDDII